MSTTHGSETDPAVAACRPADVTPVELAADDLPTTAPEYLRDLKADLAAEGYQPATVTAQGCFAEDCSLATQQEADRLRDVVRAASFLGAGRVVVTADEVADPGKVEPALEALAERAAREGVTFTVQGDVDVA